MYDQEAHLGLLEYHASFSSILSASACVALFTLSTMYLGCHMSMPSAHVHLISSRIAIVLIADDVLIFLKHTGSICLIIVPLT